MSKFGLDTYYNNNNDNTDDSNEDGSGCILHLSIASVKGNIIPLMLQQRQRKRSRYEGSDVAAAIGAAVTTMTNHDDKDKNSSTIRRIMLYTDEERETIQQESSIPYHIPMKVTCVKCEFGKDKQCTIPI
jgi:hypothetical protein